MTARFFDRQDAGNPLNGITLSSEDDIATVFEHARDREPFFCELLSDSGSMLLMGMGRERGCIQFTEPDNSHFRMAIEVAPLHQGKGELSFLMGGTRTPVPEQFALSLATERTIVRHFVRTGEMLPSISWVEI